jgi:hypothetical protein
MKCDCTAWCEYMPQLEAQQVFCALQSAGPEWTGSPFLFCPWCGKKLSVVMRRHIKGVPDRVPSFWKTLNV